MNLHVARRHGSGGAEAHQREAAYHVSGEIFDGDVNVEIRKTGL